MALSRSCLIVFRAVLAAALLITMFLATTQDEFLIIEDTNDKLNHILAFYVLAFLVDYSTPNIRFNLSKAITILGYGLLIEVIQHFLPYRVFSFFDLAANGIGIAAYALSQPALSRFAILRKR